MIQTLIPLKLKNKFIIGILVGTLFIFSNAVFAQENKVPAFKLIPLGVSGGLDEGNLSAYLLTSGNSNRYICLDAGTLHDGIVKTIQNKIFLGSPDQVLKRNIIGYCISHGHLDHLSGLVLNSPNDSSKFIYALPSVIQIMKDKYFTWTNWANFTNEGDKPTLGKYKYVPLVERRDTLLNNTNLVVKAFSLSHGKDNESTAFLLSHNGNYVLYLGDTGADIVENSHKLDILWKYIAPFVKNHRMKAILLEISFPDEVADKSLFGHLNPHLFMKEMESLNTYSDGNLKGVKIYITHIKPCIDCEERIKTQVTKENLLGLNLFYPIQGSLINLY